MFSVQSFSKIPVFAVFPVSAISLKNWELFGQGIYGDSKKHRATTSSRNRTKIILKKIILRNRLRQFRAIPQKIILQKILRTQWFLNGGQFWKITWCNVIIFGPMVRVKPRGQNFRKLSRGPKTYPKSRNTPKNTAFTRTFSKSSRELLPSSLWHESGTQQELFMKTCSEDFFYLGWIFRVDFPPVTLRRKHSSAKILKTSRNTLKSSASDIFYLLWLFPENLRSEKHKGESNQSQKSIRSRHSESLPKY